MDRERTLRPSAFATDDGMVDPAVATALAAARSGEVVDYLRAVSALCASRVLVPVVAHPTIASAPAAREEAGPAGGGDAARDDTEMAVVLLATPDGRRALVGFSGLAALRAWRSEARPVPVTLDLAARSALAEHAEALLIDPAGPHPFALDGEVLEHVARGHRLVEVDDTDAGFGWVMPAPGSGSSPEAGSPQAGSRQPDPSPPDSPVD